MEINERLKELSEIFNKNNADLFIVGGFVRDYFLNKKSFDIDLSSKLLPKQIVEMLNKSQFDVFDINEKFGTLKIKCKEIVFEHSTFRMESYLIKGRHCPNKVDFVYDVYVDAKRRDFTCNAIYYNINKNEIVDFFNGIEHIKNKLIVAVDEKTFENDGLRIVRLARFAKTLNFEIEPKTLNEAIKNLNNIKEISKEKQYCEFEKMFINLKNKEEIKKNTLKFLQEFENNVKSGKII